MVIGLIVAMQKELDLLLPLISELQSGSIINGFSFYSGKLASHGVVVMICGIGKVNAALGTLTLIESYNPDYIINTGVAGGASHQLHVLDILIATGVAYHDVWCGPGTLWGQACGYPQVFQTWQKIIDVAHNIMTDNHKIKYGLICSGDKFISTEEEIRQISSQFPEVLAVDMESAAIAQVATLRGIPFNIIRVISDTPGAEENISQYENFWSDAPKESFDVLVKLLNNL